MKRVSKHLAPVRRRQPSQSEGPCQSSYQTYRSSNYGDLPVVFFLAQWGWESGWGGPGLTTHYNPGQQSGSCGVGTTNGTEPNGYPSFTTASQGMYSYASLLINGYPHVQDAYGRGLGVYLVDAPTALSWAFSALGKGYEAGH